jgi:hypothetical protein
MYYIQISQYFAEIPKFHRKKPIADELQIKSKRWVQLLAWRLAENSNAALRANSVSSNLQKLYRHLIKLAADMASQRGLRVSCLLNREIK